MISDNQTQTVLLTQEPQISDSSYKAAVLTVTLLDELRCTVVNTGELSLILRKLDIPFHQEMKARLAFNERTSFRTTVETTADDLQKIGFIKAL